MKQRVGIAQAIINDPELLLLDEPTAGLDLERRDEFHALLRDMGQAACIVLTTHQLDDITEACSTATVLSRGRIAFRNGRRTGNRRGLHGSPAPKPAQETTAPPTRHVLNHRKPLVGVDPGRNCVPLRGWDLGQAPEPSTCCSPSGSFSRSSSASSWSWSRQP